MARPLRCIVGWHRWAKRHLDGEPYLVCTRCGKVSHGPGPTIDMGGGGGIG
jgi:hypothetical protein